MNGSRPLDWSAVGWDRDPTPGDPDAVAELAARFRRTAEAIRTAADGLDRIHRSESYVGEGGDALRERTRDLAQKVGEVEQRYAEAADALNAYHPEQYAAQRMADDALRRAQSAQHQQFSASSTLSQLPGPPVDGTVEDFQVTTARSAAQRADSDARATIGQAQDDVRRAYEWQDEAGARAARKLRDVIADDGLSDSGLDDVKGNTIDKIPTGWLKVMAKWADRIAAAAAVIALAANVIPIFGQAVAAIAGAVALAATVVSLVSHSILAERGKGGWGAAAWAVVGLVTLGLGRMAKVSGRVAVNATRARVFQNVAKPKPLTAVGRRHGKTVTNYAQARKLIGGPLGPAKKALPLATPKGLRAEGRRAMSPKVVTKDVWRDISTRRPAMSRREWVRDLARPWGETFDPIRRIDPSLLKAENVTEYLALAEKYRRRAVVAGVGDRVVTAQGLYTEGRSLLAGGSDGSEEMQGAPLPTAEIETQRLTDDALADRREQALVDIGYNRWIVPVPVRGQSAPDPQRDAVRS